jgi:hypothetical protein
MRGHFAFDRLLHPLGVAMSAQPEPSSEQAITPEQFIDAVYSFAAQLLMDGVAPAEIEKRLVEKGLDAESAQIVVTNLKAARSKAMKEAGQKNMLYGALWCIGGLIVTAVTFQAAAGGGSYVIAWGAILFGGIQFFRGLMQSSGE